MLAMSRVADVTRCVSNGKMRKVADLVEAEKLGCRSGSDSVAEADRIGPLRHRARVEERSWRNLVDRPHDRRRTRQAGRHGLRRRAESPAGHQLCRRTPRKDAASRSKAHSCGRRSTSRQCQEYALRLQNADGSWGPYFLAARTAGADAALRTCDRPADVLEWLAISLPEEKLTDPHMVSGVECVLRLVGSERYQWNAPSLSTREIVSLGHALHALAIYDQRAFARFDTSEKPSATAARTDESASR